MMFGDIRNTESFQVISSTDLQNSQSIIAYYVYEEEEEFINFYCACKKFSTVVKKKRFLTDSQPELHVLSMF